MIAIQPRTSTPVAQPAEHGAGFSTCTGRRRTAASVCAAARAAIDGAAAPAFMRPLPSSRVPPLAQFVLEALDLVVEAPDACAQHASQIERERRVLLHAPQERLLVDRQHACFAERPDRGRANLL